jgi:hypothetical protein
MIDLLSANHTLVGIEPVGSGYGVVEFDPSKPYENVLALPKASAEALKRALSN